jgi:hypothetical protein
MYHLELPLCEMMNGQDKRSPDEMNSYNYTGINRRNVKEKNLMQNQFEQKEKLKKRLYKLNI